MPGIANPQNLNRYSYVTNNPLRYIDPTGHELAENEYGGGCSTSGYCGSTPYSPPPPPVNYCDTHPNACGGNGGGGSGQGNGGGSTPTPSPVLTPTQAPTPSPETTSTPAPGGVNNYDCFTHPYSCGTQSSSTNPVYNVAEFWIGAIMVVGGLALAVTGAALIGIALGETILAAPVPVVDVVVFMESLATASWGLGLIAVGGTSVYQGYVAMKDALTP